MKRAFKNLAAALLLLTAVFCESAFSKDKDAGPMKNWDTVRRALSYYDDKPLDEALADLGENYTQGEDQYTFFSPSGDSQLVFSVKKGKIKGASYGGAYADILSFLESVPKLKVWEIQAAADAWLGFSPESLQEAFGAFVRSSSDKSIVVGPSDEERIEFKISVLDPAATGESGGAGKRYVKKAEVKGTYDGLKDCLVRVPQDAVQVKKLRGRKGRKDIAKASAGSIEQTSQKKKFALFYSDDNSNALQSAMKDQNLVAAEWFIENEICDLNHWNMYGRTPLNDAVDLGDTDILKILIEHGAKIKRDAYVLDPVVQTVTVGNVEAAELFKSLGVNYNFTQADGKNMVHLAVLSSQKDIIPFLVKSGCKIDAADSEGATPLLLAIAEDDSDMLLALVANGAQIERKNAAGQTPIFYAVEKSAGSSLQALVESKADIEAKDGTGRTPFLFAYEVDNIDAADRLLKAGASFPRTQLLQALKDKKYSYLPMLLKAGASVSVADVQGRNVLHIAADASDASSLSLFLEAKESAQILNAKDNKGSVPLLLACGAGTGFTNGVQILLDAGASVLEIDNSGNTALHASVLNNRDASSKELCQIILGKDASILNRQSRSGQTALMISLKNKKAETAAYLLDRRPDVLLKDSSGNTSLHYACDSGMEGEAKRIVSFGADVNAVNARSETPIGIAAKNKSEGIAEYLLATSGIKIDIKDSSGKSPRDYLWDLYDLRMQESAARREKLSRERQDAWDAAARARDSKYKTEQEVRDLERENRDLQYKIDTASEGTSTSGWSSRITANNVSIAFKKVAISIDEGTINKMNKQADECSRKIKEEFALTDRYLEKKKNLNKIPRQ